jgi:RNA polymerase sigma-70 factor (ECF subfamily)
LALSTANLYSAVQPGGSLFGLQESNPVSTEAAYPGPSSNYGTAFDPPTGQKVGGVNVFGGGLALYMAAATPTAAPERESLTRNSDIIMNSFLQPSAEATPERGVTQLLLDWKSGNKEALELLVPLVYQELRRLADHYLRDDRAAATIQLTALVHEAYLRLVSQNVPNRESRAHFFGVAAHLMRQFLVDQARRRRSSKRGSEAEKISSEDTGSFAPARGRDIEELDDALTTLAGFDERKTKVIELRFFGGFSIEETAQALSISTATIAREQRMAEASLHREMARGEGAGT